MTTTGEAKSTTARTRYRHTGLVLVRASTDPGGLDPPWGLDLSDSSAVKREGRAWLAKSWARPDVREALSLASPSLAARIQQLLDDDGDVRPVRDVRRAVVSVWSYLLRWQRRATPFGMFAGVGVASVGRAQAEVGTGHRAVVRADAEWLTMLVDRLQRHRRLRPRLVVVADDTATVRDGRVIVQRPAEIGACAPGPLRESSVRLTRPVRFALAAASAPIRVDALVAGMTAQFPTATDDQLDAVVFGLVEAGLLITSLRAPMTVVDGLAHLIGALRAADGSDLADISDLLHELEQIGALMAGHNSARDQAAAARARIELGARMAALVPEANQALAVDMRLDGRIAIPERVLVEAGCAASILVRIGTQPFGAPHWLDYHARFRARYGPGALVAVRELVADSGLGYPHGYLGAPRARPAWRTLTQRDAALLALIQQATVTGADEVELTDADLDALAISDHRDVVAPQRVELGVVVHAESAAAIDRGEFRLSVTAAPRVPTSMAGRFAHLLDDTERARLAATYAVQPTPGEDDALAVQLSFPPRRRRDEHVVRVPPLLPVVVSLSEHPDPGLPGVRAIGVDDLAVTADADALYLVEGSTGRRVIPRIPHALDLTVQTMPLARFIAEIADARSAVFRGLDYGAARTLPYIPRIRYRRIVLAAARWLLTTADVDHLPGAGSTADALLDWRRRWRVPARAVLCVGELRLPLDLDRQLDRAMLHTELRRTGRVELQEDGPPDGQAWVGRPAELLIPLVAVAPRARPLPRTGPPGAVLRPGDAPVLHAQLVGNPARFDELIAAHLPKLTGALDGNITSWWLRRHRDMIRPESDQHLAVFLRLTSPERYGPAAARLAAFAADLESRGLPCQLALVSHYQQPARFGNGPAIATAEQVFAADTQAAIAQITVARATDTPAQALAAASMAHLAAAFAPDRRTGLQALVDCLPRDRGPVDRSMSAHALALTDPDDRDRAVRDLPGGEAVAEAWRTRDAALTAYHRALVEQRHEPRTVLRTLLHEHHIRAVGVDPTIERTTGRLARAAALRHLALTRPPSSAPA